MPRYLIFLLALVACQQETKKEKQYEKFEKNYSAWKSDTAEAYAEYLGKLEIDASTYEVYNRFSRVMAAQNWHGQSRLIFISGKDTLSYMMNSNKDFPAAIDSNKLYFPQTKERVGIEILRDVICVGPGGCIDKEDSSPRFDYLSTVKADSIEQIFRGQFPKE